MDKDNIKVIKKEIAFLVNSRLMCLHCMYMYVEWSPYTRDTVHSPIYVEKCTKAALF